MASVRLITFGTDSPFEGNSLIVERYDIPTRSSLESEPLKIDLMLQKDTCSLLLEHVTFSWLVGNGDLHSKNISTARLIRSGALGDPPRQRAIEYAPLYDLLNTTLAIPDDGFAIPANGKRRNLRVRDIASVAARWNGSKKDAERLIAEVANNIRTNLHPVLASAHLPSDLSERYYAIVDRRLRSFGA